jgi:hypothetical protein
MGGVRISDKLTTETVAHAFDVVGTPANCNGGGTISRTEAAAKAGLSKHEPEALVPGVPQSSATNDPCPCGKKYKRCHGQ